jgi:hypothetical protein
MKVPMKTKTTIFAATLIAAIPAWSTSVFAADACEPIVRATQAKEKAERWRVRTEVVEKGKPSAVPEGIIVPEGTYHKSGDRWIKLPFSASSAKKLAGTLSYTDCRSLVAKCSTASRPMFMPPGYLPGAAWSMRKAMPSYGWRSLTVCRAKWNRGS